MNIHDIMQQLVEMEGSDIHIVVGTPPTLRVHGALRGVDGAPSLNAQQAEALIYPLLSQEQKDYVKVNKELDFGYQFRDLGRFRINVYHTQGNLAAALRLIPTRIKTLEELQLPPIFGDFCMYKQGLVLITGPTGEGKSTTLAAMIDQINSTRSEHIVTIEDPIEFVYTPKQSILSQREINHDTHGWDIALKSVLREDPDVVLIGEMRDYETIASAITIAETGHLVFATLHTASAAQTVDRIIDVFPAHQQGQVRQQLAATLKAVASQRLLVNTSGTRVAALEIMVANPAIRNLIREAKSHQIDTVMQTSADVGMMLIESHLQRLVQQGVISAEAAYESAFRPEEIARLLGGAGAHQVVGH
jgi:twitching motility protein PilT